MRTSLMRLLAAASWHQTRRSRPHIEEFFAISHLTQSLECPLLIPIAAQHERLLRQTSRLALQCCLTSDQYCRSFTDPTVHDIIGKCAEYGASDQNGMEFANIDKVFQTTHFCRWKEQARSDIRLHGRKSFINRSKFANIGRRW